MKKFWGKIPDTYRHRSVFKTFPFHHGFAAGRSDWQDEELGAAAHEAYELLAGVFEANL